MNISKPDSSSSVYKQFINSVLTKVGQAEVWLIEHKIDYVWNYWLGDHLYRIYIPDKDLLLDFEYYPKNNYSYSYIRINFDTDIIQLLENLFHCQIVNTKDLQVAILERREANRFLKDNGASPIYDKEVFRLAWVKNADIYQCIIIKNNKVIANVTKQGYSVALGTYMLLRYLTETFGYSELLIPEHTDNSVNSFMYQIIGAKVISQTTKKKIWWSPTGTKWHIKREDTDKYIPFYYCEYRIYKYSR